MHVNFGILSSKIKNENDMLQKDLDDEGGGGGGRGRGEHMRQVFGVYPRPSVLNSRCYVVSNLM